jgi:integrase
VYYADGRSNTKDVGRHSLGTRDRNEALERLRQLDVVEAVENKLADPAVLESDARSSLPLEVGKKRYLEYVSRPPVQGGATASSVKRYRAVFDKFVAFARRKGLRDWNEVSKETLSRYSLWLEEEDYGDATQYLELTTLKQVLKWMVGEKLLSTSNLVALKLKNSQGTSTYCYSHEQVQAIVAFCAARDDLRWLGHVVVALGTTGLRIGELAGLRRQDVDLERGVVHLRDTTRQVRRSARHEARTTKSHRDRSLPIADELRAVLQQLPHSQDGRVFHGPHGGKIKPDTVRNVLRREVLAPLAKSFPAQGSDPGIVAGRLHSLRHLFCSVSADNDVPEQMLMSWLGHRDSKMISRYYHLRHEESRKHMARIAFLGTKRTDASDG